MVKAIFNFEVCTIVGDERDELGVRFLSRWRCRARRPLKGCPEILTFREIGSHLSLTPSFLIWRVAIPFASDAPAAATRSTSASPRPMIFCFSRVTLAQVATLCVPSQHLMMFELLCLQPGLGQRTQKHLCACIRAQRSGSIVSRPSNIHRRLTTFCETTLPRIRHSVTFLVQGECCFCCLD